MTSPEELLAKAETCVSISFTVTDAQLNLEQNHKDARRSIAMELRLEEGNDVSLPTFHSLRTSAWSIYLVEATDASLANVQEQRIGTLLYFDESSNTEERGHMEVTLTPELFTTLLSALCSRLPPDHINVTVQGLKYGAAPDGSDVVWDVASNPRAPITNVSFRTVLYRHPQNNRGT